jgi:hypothetical protein
MKRALAIAITMVIAATSLTACEEIPSPQLLVCAELEDFKPVSNVLERRCGTLDCHGEYARPLRIYGQNGLRLATRDELIPDNAQENDTLPGGKGTTDEEVELNWRSVCGLEPERTAQVVAGNLSPRELILIRKPLQLETAFEKHKGGQLFLSGGPGEVCVSCWLLGFPDTPECADALTGCADAVASGTL